MALTPKTGNARFHVAGRGGGGFKLVSYPLGRADFPTESNETWATAAEAEAACARVNAGDESGLHFACYADD